jgi:hypothetical protein
MEFTEYVRKPFTVQATEVTVDNMHELAKSIGEVREEEDGTLYILVDPRLVPNVPKVFVGYFVTKMKKNVRCYSRNIFQEQFTKMTPEIQPWVEWMDSHGSTAKPEVPEDGTDEFLPSLAEEGNRLGID